jgi:diguanylate cyclase (GGDEF)-like protein
MTGQPRTRQDSAVSVARHAALVFVLIAAMIGAVVVTLDRNAKRSSWQQSTAELGGGARVAASAFGALQANLRVNAGQLATSLPLQRAVVTHDHAALLRIAKSRHARILLGGRSIGTLAPPPRIASTATISDGVHVLATVTIALPLGKDVLALIRQATPLPRHAALMFARHDKVIAGGPLGAPVRIRDHRVNFGKTDFAAQSAALGVAGVSVLAVEPTDAIDALSRGYRHLVLLAAAFTLALAAALATRLGRPVARVLGDVARLTRQAQTDPLTGLANRRTLNERLEEELEHAARTGASVSFVIADIDDFKQINDGHGHQTGDEIIRAVARVLGGSVRELDLAARYGGEEFVLVLPGAKLANARQTAERVRRAIEELEVTTPAGGTASVTVSFGVAQFPTYATSEALVEAADGALYEAKRSGKNRVATATARRKHQTEKAARSLASPV